MIIGSLVAPPSVPAYDTYSLHLYYVVSRGINKWFDCLNTRIVQHTNKVTAFIILQSVLKSGAHKPSNKWVALVKLLWVSPPNQGPLFRVYREWSKSGVPRTLWCLSMHHSAIMIMGSLILSRTPTLPPSRSRPWPGASVVRRLWRFEDCQRREVTTRHVVMCYLENDYKEHLIGMFPDGYGINVLPVRGAPPLRQQQLKDVCALLAESEVLQLPLPSWGAPWKVSFCWRFLFCSDFNDTMAAPQAIPRSHLPNGSIQRLLVKHCMCSIGGDAHQIAPPYRCNHQNSQWRASFIFLLGDFFLAHNHSQCPCYG